MRCTVCEHCQTPVRRENLTLLDGFSYHEKCRKCYVCSETNLQNAEVFKGVIFCSGCSQRIFQGCSTARRTKEINRKTRDRVRSIKRSYRTRHSRRRSHNHILEMAGLGASTCSSKSRSDAGKESKLSESLAVPTEIALTAGKPVFDNISHKSSKDIKRRSTEIGMTTEVTQELLKEMNCPVIYDKKTGNVVQASVRSPTKKKVPCSDLRIAELGVSTEIANMALRRKSELPVIIKSKNCMTPMNSESQSLLNQESDFEDGKEKWFDSAYSTLPDPDKTCVIKRLMDRRIGSLLKLPYIAFRKNVLTRSSLISVLMSKEDNESILENIKLLFKQEITSHQRRGLKRLYSTINRKQTPNKLGWLNLVANAYGIDGAYKLRRRDGRPYHKCCKHFKGSHSYRCMRAQVMKLAGPTKSELAVYRDKMKNLIAPGFLRTMSIQPRYTAIMTSEACGTSRPCTSARS